MLTKREWVKKYVVKWQGIKNCDTHTVEGGYLWLRNKDGSISGLSERGINSRSKAIDHHYAVYVNMNRAAMAGVNFSTPVTAHAADE
jgi:hypothetical protein